MADPSFAPQDDPTIPCKVRLWQGGSVHAFVHPRDWSKVSFGGICPMIVTCLGVTFPCQVMSGGEHYRSGWARDLDPTVFGVPTHGDYPATACIDWPAAIPDILRQGLEQSPTLHAAWRRLSCDQMRAHLARINRAQKPSTQTERQLAVLNALSD